MHDMIVKYISLLCEHSPEQVLPFIISRDDYDTEEILDLCKRHNIVDARTYLHEQLDQHNEALDMIDNTIEAQFKEIEDSFLRGPG
ncbi:MAG: hypothetical protein V2I33_20470, partial [Kangiellaceae bacterium]|nr:hypothetical protein [Kangiellaceae bacterium]